MLTRISVVWFPRVKSRGKVGIATGGGSGHLPLFLDYVGEGLLDGCCVGGVFQSPSAGQMLAVTKEIDQGGRSFIYLWELRR